jgi:hypothetical protein
MKKHGLVFATAVLAAALPLAGPAHASHDCSHPDALVAGKVAAGVAPAGGESHWYSLSTSSPVRVQIWNTRSQTAMQVFTSNCATLVCNTAQLGGTCLTNGGSWRIRVWSSGGSDYAVTVTPVV